MNIRAQIDMQQQAAQRQSFLTGQINGTVGFNSERELNANVATFHELPVYVTPNWNFVQQDANGNFYILDGYSYTGGPDVPRP
jgi:cell wall assembly regulator SMI1